MKPAFPHQTNLQASGFSESEKFLHNTVENNWDSFEGLPREEKQFNSFKYVILTGVLVLLIALTVFVSNRNQVSEQKQNESTQLISFFKQ